MTYRLATVHSLQTTDGQREAIGPIARPLLK